MPKKHEAQGKTSERSRGAHAPSRTRAPRAKSRAQSDDKSGVREVLERGKDKVSEFRDAAAETATGWAKGAREAASTAVDRTQEALAPVSESVRHNAWPAALIGAGLTWVLVNNVRGAGAAESARTRTAKRQVTSAARRTAAGSSSAFGEMQSNVWRFVRQNPLLAGATALGIGIVASMTLPATEPENELLGEARDTMVDRAKGLAHGTVEAVQGVAEGVQHLVGKS